MSLYKFMIIPYSSKFSWFKNFVKLLKNHMNVNFRDKNFVIATFFRDYLRTAVPARTIHVVAPPIILTHGVGACKRKINRNNAEPFRILVLHQRLSIRLDALRRRDTYGRLVTFVIRLLFVAEPDPHLSPWCGSGSACVPRQQQN